MHRKKIFALAGVFLVLALVVPPVLIVLAANNTIYKYIVPYVNPTEGSNNITITLTSQERATYNTTLTVALILEAIFVVLFAITLYYGINHPHPEH